MTDGIWRCTYDGLYNGPAWCIGEDKIWWILSRSDILGLNGGSYPLNQTIDYTKNNLLLPQEFME